MNKEQIEQHIKSNLTKSLADQTTLNDDVRKTVSDALKASMEYLADNGLIKLNSEPPTVRGLWDEVMSAREKHLWNRYNRLPFRWYRDFRVSQAEKIQEMLRYENPDAVVPDLYELLPSHLLPNAKTMMIISMPVSAPIAYLKGEITV